MPSSPLHPSNSTVISPPPVILLLVRVQSDPVLVALHEAAQVFGFVGAVDGGEVATPALAG